MADEILDGSCLCGAVRYRVRGPFMRFSLTATARAAARPQGARTRPI